MAKRKRVSKDLQSITQKANDPGTRTPLTPECELMYSERIDSSCSTTCGVFVRNALALWDFAIFFF